MVINRIWAMPNRETFKIKPISKLLTEEMDGFWIDPFAGYNSPASITNDLNPATPTTYHLEALDFLKQFSDDSVDGVLFDPPYSFYELLRCYKGVGKKINKWGENNAFWSQRKNEVARVVRVGGRAICFGWNTVGIGKTRGFKLERVLLICHGSARNDTLVTVERKGGINV